MTTANKFLEAVRQTGGTQDKADFWASQQELWMEDLEELRLAVRGWLQPLVEANAMSIADVLFPVTEPDLGTYEAPGLSLDLRSDPPKRVEVRPRGARVVGVVEDGGNRVLGASGRVDLECGVRRQILLRFRDGGETRWRSFGTGTKLEVNEETFFELMSRVTDIHPKP